MARMNIYFSTQKEVQDLKDHAKKLGISPSALVRLALRKLYDKVRHEEKVERHG